MSKSRLRSVTEMKTELGLWCIVLPWLLLKWSFCCCAQIPHVPLIGLYSVCLPAETDGIKSQVCFLGWVGYTKVCRTSLLDLDRFHSRKSYVGSLNKKRGILREKGLLGNRQLGNISQAQGALALMDPQSGTMGDHFSHQPLHLILRQIHGRRPRGTLGFILWMKKPRD